MLSDSTPGRAAPAATAGLPADPSGLLSAIVRTAPCSRSTAPRRRGAAAADAQGARAVRAIADDNETAGPAPLVARAARAPLRHPDSGVANRRRSIERDRRTTRSASPPL